MSAPPIRLGCRQEFGTSSVSAAVGADQTKYFARAKVEVQALNGNPMTVVLGYVPDRDKSFPNGGTGGDVDGDGFSVNIKEAAEHVLGRLGA